MAIVLERPEPTSIENAAAIVSPSLKLWITSPRSIIQANGDNPREKNQVKQLQKNDKNSEVKNSKFKVQ